MKHAIVLVGFEPDWEALYVENVKVAEGHHVSPAELVKHTAQYVYDEWGADSGGGRWVSPPLETTHVEEDEANSYGEHHIPEFLNELEHSAPRAFARISA